MIGHEYRRSAVPKPARQLQWLFSPAAATLKSTPLRKFDREQAAPERGRRTSAPKGYRVIIVQKLLVESRLNAILWEASNLRHATFIVTLI